MIEWLRHASSTPHVDISGHCLPVLIKRHNRAKRMTLRLAPDGSVIHVTIPQWARTREALDFANARRDWLEAQCAKLAENKAAACIAARGTLPYRGDNYTIAWQEGAARAVRLDEDQITLGGPEEAIAARLERWLKNQAKTLLLADIAEYCERVRLPVATLRLTNARRRWGSCSHQRIIRINWRLIMAPDSVRRSVVAHETAHLLHFDHSPAFHALLANLFEGDLPAANQWLRAHGGKLYRPFG